MSQSRMTYLAFYKGTGKWWNKLIRLWTRGPYSHCEIVTSKPNSWRKTAQSLSASEWDGGVRKKTIDFTTDNWDLIPVAIDCDRLSQAKGEIGAKYDWVGILFSQILPLSREHPDKWFCSELAAFVIGLPDPHHFSPNSLYRKLKETC
ncbi:hypothetical protein [Kiloniella sp. b19]|uniref:hypothetical protein n=1 Tax=Kiloniella sp. GXU_MW_B19 TaxID=3141326 RepID=UPI0031E19298